MGFDCEASPRPRNRLPFAESISGDVKGTIRNDLERFRRPIRCANLSGMSFNLLCPGVAWQGIIYQPFSASFE